jgi:hypothetical protein
MPASLALMEQATSREMMHLAVTLRAPVSAARLTSMWYQKLANHVLLGR